MVRGYSRTVPVAYACPARYMRRNHALPANSPTTTTGVRRQPSHSAAPSPTASAIVNRPTPAHSAGGGHSDSTMEPGRSLRHIPKYAGSVSVSK